MATASRKAYAINEVYRFDANGTTAVTIATINPGTMITRMYCRIVTAASGTAGNLIIGDDDDDNGFIVAFDGQGTAGTVYGDDVTEGGAYLYDATKKGGQTKYYAAAKSILGVLSGASTGGTYDVIVEGFRYDPT
jgi:hypothetical protein